MSSLSPILYMTVGYLLCKNYSTEIETSIAVVLKDIKKAIENRK